MPKNILIKFTSRKFIISLVGLVIVTLSASLASTGDIVISDDNLWQVIALILGYLGVEGAADIVRSWREAAIKESEQKE